MKASIPKMRNVPIGNFGKAKIKCGSKLSDLGITKAEVVHITKEGDYLQRLYDAFDKTEDAKLKKFIFEEIRKILIRHNKW